MKMMMINWWHHAIRAHSRLMIHTNVQSIYHTESIYPRSIHTPRAVRKIKMAHLWNPQVCVHLACDAQLENCENVQNCDLDGNRTCILQIIDTKIAAIIDRICSPIDCTRGDDCNGIEWLARHQNIPQCKSDNNRSTSFINSIRWLQINVVWSSINDWEKKKTAKQNEKCITTA